MIRRKNSSCAQNLRVESSHGRKRKAAPPAELNAFTEGGGAVNTQLQGSPSNVIGFGIGLKETN